MDIKSKTWKPTYCNKQSLDNESKEIYDDISKIKNTIQQRIEPESIIE